MIQKLIVLIGAMFLLLISGNVIGDTSVIVNLKSALLVIGGPMMSTFLAFPMKTIKGLFRSLLAAFREEEADQEALVRQVEDLARVWRQQGIKSLEEEGKKVRNPFLSKGIELVTDGYDRFEIRNIMEKEYELYLSRKESQVSVLNTLAKLAPVFGFVGTIIGLIDVLGNIGEPAQIGKGMALALLTTFYGLLFANFLFMPLSRKLTESIKYETTLLHVILEGVLDIADQKNAKSISYRLNSYLNVGGMHSVNAPREKEEPKRPRTLRVPSLNRAAVRN